MTDIVESLTMRDAGENADTLIEIMHEAAAEIERERKARAQQHFQAQADCQEIRQLHAEIERLRAENAKLREELEDWTIVARQHASYRAALEEICRNGCYASDVARAALQKDDGE